MHILSPKFLQPLNDAQVEIINLHPALPGEYNGAVSLASPFLPFPSPNLSPLLGDLFSRAPYRQLTKKPPFPHRTPSPVRTRTSSPAAPPALAS